jgi:3-hydroxybutyryl-CoA dehydrogenase
VNRVLMPMLNEACFALYEGIGVVEDIDTAIKLGLNHPMGPFDAHGSHRPRHALAILEVCTASSAIRSTALPVAAPVRGGGWLGRKAGRGFHHVPAGRARPGEEPRERPRLEVDGSAGDVAS